MLQNVVNSIESLELEDLIELQSILADQIKAKQAQKESELIEQFRMLAQQNGLSLESLLEANGLGGKAKRKKRGPMPMKYANPKNPEEKWSGVGRQPRWVQSHLAGGGTMKEVSI